MIAWDSNSLAVMAMVSPSLSPQVVVPIVAMRAGTDYQTYVDLLVPGQAKISLLQVGQPRAAEIAEIRGRGDRST